MMMRVAMLFVACHAELMLPGQSPGQPRLPDPAMLNAFHQNALAAAAQTAQMGGVQTVVQLPTVTYDAGAMPNAPQPLLSTLSNNPLYNKPGAVQVKISGEGQSPEMEGLSGASQLILKQSNGGLPAAHEESFLKPQANPQPNDKVFYFKGKDEGMTFFNHTDNKAKQVQEGNIKLQTHANATAFANIVVHQMGDKGLNGKGLPRGTLSDMHRDVPAPDSKWYENIPSSSETTTAAERGADSGVSALSSESLQVTPTATGGSPGRTQI